MKVSSVATVLAMLGLSGCNVLPGGAPTAYQIEHPDDEQVIDGFYVGKLDASAAATLAQQPVPLLSETFHDMLPMADIRVGPGDTLQISIWEAGGPGLFGFMSNGGTAHNATFQAAIVDQEGYLSIPFAGRLRAAGKTPTQIEREIAGALKDRALDPQVMVLLAAPGANVVTVGGDVNQASIRPLDLRGDRLLDEIAAAGGAKFEPYETDVQLTRRGKALRVTLQRVVDDPVENIYIQPGDSIFVSHNPPSFSAVGAANRVGQYPFNMPKLFLSEAISMAGGLVDVQADTGGVYLFRAVPKITAAALFPKVQLPADEKPVHVALRLDLSSASGYVLAQQTLMRDKDLILLTNAKGTQLLKLFGLVRGVSAPIGDIRGSVQGARN